MTSATRALTSSIVDRRIVPSHARSTEPGPPDRELRYWYQWYLHTERGAAGLAANRADFCRLLWRMWSPTYPLTDAEYAATAASFDNPDFVATVVQSYRHRHKAAAGDPGLEGIEARLAEQPPITVPTVAFSVCMRIALAATCTLSVVCPTAIFTSIRAA